MKRSDRFLAAIAAYDANDSKLALQLMEQCAESGDPVACYTTALWYRDGEGAPCNVSRSAFWMKRLWQLAEQDDSLAQWELSCKLRWGVLLPLNIEQANYWLERSAASGYGEAQHQLAWYHETGQFGYAVDANTAAEWYSRAFAQDNPETVYLFAIRKFKDGVPTDEAMQLLRKAACMGFKQASHVLAAHQH